jgi:hypothetical protein
MSSEIPALPEVVKRYTAQPPYEPGQFPRVVPVGAAEAARIQNLDPNSWLRRSFLAALDTFHLLQELEKYVVAQQLIQQQQAENVWREYVDMLSQRREGAAAGDVGGDPIAGTPDAPSDTVELTTPLDGDEEDPAVMQQKLLPEYIALLAALDEEDEAYLRELGLAGIDDADIKALRKHEKTVEQIFAEQPEQLAMFKQLHEKIKAHLNAVEPHFAIAVYYLAPAALAAMVKSGKDIAEITEENIENLANTLQNKAQKVIDIAEKVQNGLTGILHKIKEISGPEAKFTQGLKQ